MDERPIFRANHEEVCVYLAESKSGRIKKITLNFLQFCEFVICFWDGEWIHVTRNEAHQLVIFDHRGWHQATPKGYAPRVHDPQSPQWKGCDADPPTQRFFLETHIQTFSCFMRCFMGHGDFVVKWWVSRRSNHHVLIGICCDAPQMDSSHQDDLAFTLPETSSSPLKAIPKQHWYSNHPFSGAKMCFSGRV